MSATISVPSIGIRHDADTALRTLGHLGLGLLSTLFPLVVIGLRWEVVARMGIFPDVLFPPISQVLSTAGRLISRGIMQQHLLSTMYRLLAGFAIAAVFAVPLGLLMARSKVMESFWVPIVSVLNPIPGLAWVPLFLLWFKLGDTAVIALVTWATFPPVVINTWTGAKTVNEIWVRAAQSMGARGSTLYRKVMVPGALPFVLTGMRIGLSRSWRAVVAAEMLSAGGAGLGWLIFEARDFVRTDVMLAGVMMIGIVGLLLEKVLFQGVEKYTVVRWGMLHDTGS
jgi:ABC-type nitrate/sulfonate/bicarbonate transport system permease component